ncbi:MAG TPA: GNAT family N-acetyltransferase [Chitinophagaceae bacterium]|nr:GNAT family N-acetyltransferase [Chitinophagaceae bacterium]
MTETITVRKASIEDIQTLLRFEQAVIATERPFDPTLKPDPNHYYDLKRMIEDPVVELVVAECNGQLVASGYARIETSKSYLQHEHHAYVGFMYVEPAWRGKGINQMIIENLKEWSMSKGITEMRLDVYHSNLRAIKAYEKAGFGKLMLHMRMVLSKRQ